MSGRGESGKEGGCEKEGICICTIYVARNPCQSSRYTACAYEVIVSVCLDYSDPDLNRREDRTTFGWGQVMWIRISGVLGVKRIVGSQITCGKETQESTWDGRTFDHSPPFASMTPVSRGGGILKSKNRIIGKIAIQGETDYGRTRWP